MRKSDTSAEEFFSALDCGKYMELAAAVEAAERHDYDTAKTELLRYYKVRHESGIRLGFGITAEDMNYGMAVLPMRNILTGPCEFDTWQGEFFVSGSGYAEYKTDVTDRIVSEISNGAAGFMMLAGEKQKHPVYIKSRKSDRPPRLEVVCSDGGVKKTVYIDACDTAYVSSKDTGTVFGETEILPVKEDGSGADPTGNETTRAYIKFRIGGLAGCDVISAKLILSAACDTDCAADGITVLVINNGDTVWSADTLTWAGVSGSIFSYQNNDVPVWNSRLPDPDSEYHNVTARFWFGRAMAYEYLSYLRDPDEYNRTHPYSETYPGASFGPKLVQLMDAFADQMDHGWPRTLETGERLSRWVDIVDALTGTGVFDGREREFCNIISFMYGDCRYLNGLDIKSDTPWWSNWRAAANAGFFKAAEYLRELKQHDEFRAAAEYNIEYTMELLYNDDMSFKEAGPSYAQWSAVLFGDCVRAAKLSGNPLSESLRKKLIRAARYAADCFYPNGYDSNIGDSNYRDKMRGFRSLAGLLDDPVLNAYAFGEKYKNSLCTVYKDAGAVFMRTSRKPDECVYLSFINNPFDGHCHSDSNQVLMYAYGQPLIVDSGRYSYSDTNNIYNELRAARAHNTIEADGTEMACHSISAGSMEIAADNGLFILASSQQKGYSGTVHTRKVLFFKTDCIPVLIADHITGKKTRTYRQNWHFMPSSNAALTGRTVTTDFCGRANVAVSCADSESAVSTRDGWFSADYGLAAESRYASFEKTGAEVKFSAVLMPLRPGMKREITAIDTADDTSRAAVSVDGDMSFYVKYTENAGGSFCGFETDASAAFVKTTGVMMYGIACGSRLRSENGTDFISVSGSIASAGVVLREGIAEIYTDGAGAGTRLKLYAPGARKAVLNGSGTDFTSDGVYIYI